MVTQGVTREKQPEVICAPQAHKPPPPSQRPSNPRRPTALPLTALSAVGTSRPGPRTQKHKHPAHTVTRQRKLSQSHRPHPHTIAPRSHSLCSGKIAQTRCLLAQHPHHSLATSPTCRAPLWYHVDSPSLYLPHSASWCLFIFIPFSLSLSPSLTLSVSGSPPALCLSLSVFFSPHLCLSASIGWNCQSQYNSSKGLSIIQSLSGPISTNGGTGHSDTHAETDAHKTVMWGRMPTSTLIPSWSQDILNFLWVKMAAPNLRSGWELSKVLERRGKKQGLWRHSPHTL